MKDAILNTLRELLDSKKAVAAVATTVTSLVVGIAARLGFDLPPVETGALVAAIVMIGVFYLHSQGKADYGKEAYRVQAEAEEAMVVREQVREEQVRALLGAAAEDDEPDQP